MEHIFYYLEVIRKNILGGRIHEARKLKKPAITQLDLLARLQVLGVMLDQSALSKIENGQRPITDIEILAISKALEVSVDWLYKGLALPAELIKEPLAKFF